MSLHEIIINIPPGYSKVIYKDKKYALTRSDFNEGKSLKIYAEELSGTDFISFNYYITSTENHLKPCEMPEPKVIEFLKNYQPLHL